MMRQNIFGFAWLAILALLSFGGKAQMRFYMTVEPEKITTDEYATLKIVVENANTVSNLKLPSLNDFDVMSTPSRLSGRTDINGVVSKYTAYSLVIKPKKKGTFSIGAAGAEIDNKTLKSNPVQLQVEEGDGIIQHPQMGKGAPQLPFDLEDPFGEPRRQQYNENILRPGESIPEKVDANMKLRLETNKTTVYVGEPIVANYKLYARLKTESQILANPAFNGFSVVEIPQNAMVGSTTQLNGKFYDVFNIRKAQLYPMKLGSYSLDVLTLENNIRFGTGDGMVEQKVNLSSSPVQVTVLPLPEAGKPSSFNGAVGDFSFSAAVDKVAFSTDEAATLTLTIWGGGNMQLLTQPDVQWPDGINAFDAKLSDNLVTTNVPVAGSKVFEIPFTATQPGDYTLPKIEFSYFDPVAKTYKSLSSQPISIRISQGDGKSKQVLPTNIAKDQRSNFDKVFMNRKIVISLLLMGVLTGLFLFFRKRGRIAEVKENVDPSTSVETSRFAESHIFANPLKDSEVLLATAENKQFFETLYRELKNFLAEKFGLHPQELQSKNISYLLDKKGVSSQNTLMLEQLMRQIEWQLYTPFAEPANKDEMFAAAQSTLHAINKEITR